MTKQLLDTAMAEYAEFHARVERTPQYVLMMDHGDELHEQCMPAEHNRTFFRQLHAAMGMSGEAGEILEHWKKRLFGFNKPLDPAKVREEMGDLFWYFHLMCNAMEDAHGWGFQDILEDNIKKLSERYEVSRGEA